jgi:hypothetical protein
MIACLPYANERDSFPMSGSKRVLLLLCTDCLLRVGALRNAHSK